MTLGSKHPNYTNKTVFPQTNKPSHCSPTVVSWGPGRSIKTKTKGQKKETKENGRELPLKERRR